MNREVLVLPTNAYGAGNRTDISVAATAIHQQFDFPGSSASERVAVVLEVKPTWRTDLLSSQREQLVDYLAQSQTDAGIYLVAWYPIDLWTTMTDTRKTAAKQHTRDDLEDYLSTQAAEIKRDCGVLTVPFFLDIPRPHQSKDSTPKAVGDSKEREAKESRDLT